MHGLQSTLLGGLVGFSIMFGFYLLGFAFVRLSERLRKQEIEEEGLGFGDVTLGGVIGLLLGWPGIIAGLVLTILIGGAFSLSVIFVALINRRYHAALAVAYGPFLILATVYLLYFKK
jgi:leader peptidase (prepilin peptidase)/N-methyltransferase